MAEDVELVEASYEDTPWYNLDGVYDAKCLRVYDGDTATFAFRRKPGEPIAKHRCRLAGIDAPEIRGVADVEPGKAAARFLRRRIEGKIVRLSVRGTEKYGRLLVGVSVDGKDMAALLLSAGHAIQYDGTGTKASDINK